jgi:signal transduction histidine kinase/CheY-like chemotaxis protein
MRDPHVVAGADPACPPPAPDFRALFEAAPGLYLVLAPDPGFTVLAASDAYLRATLTRRDHLLGRRLFDVFPDNPDDPASPGVRNLRASLDRVLAHRAADVMPVQRSDLCRPHAEGVGSEERSWRPVNSPVFGPGGDLAAILHRLEDATEFVRAEQQGGERHRLAKELAEARRAEAAFRQADRKKDEFLAQLAHELRGPLSPLLAALHVLKFRGCNPDTLQQASDLAERQVRQLARLVDDLLDVSRVARGKLRLRKELLDVEQVVAQAVETARPLLVARQQQLTVLVPPGPWRLEADPARLVQVLVNLLSNAARYTPAGGHVWVSAERDNGDVVLSVRDDGAGLTADVAEQVFDLFYQAEPGCEAGLGIGLNLVRGLVQMHGGSVVARSDGPGTGSEFVVRLPAAPVPPAAQPRAPTRGDGVARRPLRILVVDDVIDAATSLALLLRLWGHEARTAHDGCTALEVARAFRPEVVLLDLALPGGLSGYEVARRLRAEGGSEAVLLVALTGHGQEEDRRQAGEAGFAHFCVKPVDPPALQELLSRTDGGGREGRRIGNAQAR